MTNFLAAFLGRSGLVLSAPAADGTAGQAMVTDGNKVLSFAGPFAPLTGAGTSGTWGISITGTAASATVALDAALLDGLDSTAFALASHVHSAADITSGTLPLARGGTNATTAAGARASLLPAMAGNTLKVLRVNAGETDAEWATVAAGSGDVVGPASAVNNCFALFNGTTGKLIGDSGFRSSDFATDSHEHSAADVTSGTLLAVRGGTGFGSYTVGDLLYADSTTTLAKLAVGAAGTLLIGGTTPTWSASPTVTSLTATGTVNLADGTLALPSLTFPSDPDCGFYRVSANRVAIVAGGAAALTCRNISVGVGFSGSAAAPALYLAADNDSGLFAETNVIAVSTNGLENIRFGQATQSALMTIPTSTLKGLVIKGAASQTASRLQLQTDAGASLGNVGGCIFDHFADGASASVDGTEDTLYTDTTAANTLGINGDSIEGGLTITIVPHAASTDRIQGYFAGIGIFDSTALTYAAAGTVKIRWQIIRVSSTTCRAVVEFFPAGSSAILAFATVKYTSDATLTGLNLATTNIVKWTGIAAGVGAAVGDITARIEKIKWVSQAAA